MKIEMMIKSYVKKRMYYIPKVDKSVSVNLICEKISVLGKIKSYKEKEFENTKSIYVDIACSKELEESAKKGLLLVYKFPEYCKIYKLEERRSREKSYW